MRHFLSLMDWSADEVADLLRLAAELKADPRPQGDALGGKALAMIFQKRSTRTRVSFEVGMTQLGGTALFLSEADLHLGSSETIEDTARVLARFVDGIMARVFDHNDLLRLTVGGVPVINGLSDRLHPCQALADLLTIRQHKGRLKGLKVAILGDIVNSRVARSNLFLLSRMGADVTVCGPPTLIPPFVEKLKCKVALRPEEAIEGADVVMALRLQLERMTSGLLPSLREYARLYQVNEERLARARPGALVMHPGPMNEGVEISPAVARSLQSVIEEQVTNGVAVRMAVLYLLARGKP